MSNLGFDVLLKGRNMIRLLEGLWVSLRISLIAVLISIALGLIIGTIMTRKNPVIGFITRLYLETVRIMPQMVLLFIVFFGTTKVLGINLEAEIAAIIVFSFWGTAEMADLVRGALESIPKGQKEGGMSLGLSDVQIYIYILIPQTVSQLLKSS